MEIQSREQSLGMSRYIGMNNLLMTQNPLILVKHRGVCLFYSILKGIIQQKHSQQFVRVYNCQIDKVRVLHNTTALTSVKSMLTKQDRILFWKH